MHNWHYKACRFLLQGPLQHRQCICWGRLPSHTLQRPCPANGQGEDKASATDTWCWKTNWVHQCVSDPQGKQRQLPFSPSGSSLITDGINPGLMQCCSPADPRVLSSSAGPRLQAGKLMCPGLLSKLVAGLKRTSEFQNMAIFQCSALSLCPQPMG